MSLLDTATATTPSPAVDDTARGHETGPALPSRTRRHQRRPALVAPWADSWLVGGLGIVAWLVLAEPLGSPLFGTAPAVGGVLLWAMLALTGTHFGISYHLAYGQGRGEVIRRWPQLLGVPAALVASSAVIGWAAATDRMDLAEGGIRVLLVSVFTLTGWHYLKQVYGVARVYAAINDLRIGDTEAKVLRYGLYPLWFLNASIVWMQGGRPSRYGFAGGFGVFPSTTEALFMGAALVSLLVVAGAFAALALQWRRLPPATMWTPYVAGYLWFAWRPGHISAIVVLGALHASQYLVCAHRAEVAWGEERGESRPVIWWCSVFGGALSAGMMLSYWMPMWLADSTSSAELGAVGAVLLFAFFNLHHYAVDSVIWRSNAGHVRRMVASARAGRTSVS